MTPGARASRCVGCGWQGTPERLWCPACGGPARDVLVHGGTVEEVTILRRSAGRGALTVRIGSVRLLGGGGVVVARLEPGAAAGTPVRLFEDGGAAVARPG